MLSSTSRALALFNKFFHCFPSKPRFQKHIPRSILHWYKLIPLVFWYFCGNIYIQQLAEFVIFLQGIWLIGNDSMEENGKKISLKGPTISAVSGGFCKRWSAMISQIHAEWIKILWCCQWNPNYEFMFILMKYWVIQKWRAAGKSTGLSATVISSMVRWRSDAQLACGFPSSPPFLYHPIFP